MSKVKVPAAFDKWYKQIQANDIDNYRETAILLIASQGHGHIATQAEQSLMGFWGEGFEFDLSQYDSSIVSGFVARDKEKAIRAVLDGYEVIKIPQNEPLYTIKMPYVNSGTVLFYSSDTDEFFFDSPQAYSEGYEEIWDLFTMDFIEKRVPQLRPFAELKN